MKKKVDCSTCSHRVTVQEKPGCFRAGNFHNLHKWFDLKVFQSMCMKYDRVRS